VGLIGVHVSGSTDKTERFFKSMLDGVQFSDIERYAQAGVSALELATPYDTGVAAGSWYYEISQTERGYTVSWLNADKDSSGTPIVIMLQYGHGTGTGGWVPPRDFINPATSQLFQELTDAVWKAVQSA
jgi:hypothetical protein